MQIKHDECSKSGNVDIKKTIGRVSFFEILENLRKAIIIIISSPCEAKLMQAGGDY